MIIHPAAVAQGATSNRDVLYGMGVVAAMLPVFYLIGRVAARFQNFKFSKAWAPLVPVLADPRIVEDGAAAVTSRLAGRYNDVAVFATMTPDIRRYRYSRGNGNRFSVGVEGVSGASDWSLDWTRGLPIVGTPGWSVTAADASLAARLREAGVMALVEPFGPADVHYRVHDRTLEWSAFIEPWVALPPERFRRVLDAMLELALMSRALNH